MIAGVVVETLPGAADRVGERLAALPGASLEGSDGGSRLAMVWEAGAAADLEALAQRLLEQDDEVVGVYPTFVCQEGPG